MAKKVRYTVEFPFNSSHKVLFNRLSTPGGLSEWFADNVTVRGQTFNFIWGGVDHKAELTAKKDLRYVRYTWLDDDENTYFEFRISVDELTGDTALIVVDFAEEDEVEDSKNLWETQIAELKHVIGI